MKRFFTILAVVLVFAMMASTAFAYQLTLDTSGERTQSRNATSGDIKAAYYNPAGLTSLDDGLYLDLGNRFLYLKTENKEGLLGSGLDGQTATSETYTYLLPNLALAYKMDRFAFFYNLSITNGGAGGTWDDAQSLDVVGLALSTSLGSPSASLGTTGALTEAVLTTYTLGHTFGGAFKVNDMISFAAGLRYYQNMASGELSGLGPSTGALPKELDTYLTGMAGWMGVMITPMDGMNVSLNYLSETLMKGTTTYTYAGSPDIGEGEVSWQPAMWSLGVGYTVMPNLEVQLSYNLTMNGEKSYAGGDDVNGITVYDDGDKNEQAFGLGAEFGVNEMIMASAGLSYHTTATADKNNTNPTDPSFTKYVVGFGAVITPMEKLDVELGFSYQLYQDSEGTTAGMTAYEHSRDAWVAGIGVTYKAL